MGVLRKTRFRSFLANPEGLMEAGPEFLHQGGFARHRAQRREGDSGRGLAVQASVRTSNERRSQDPGAWQVVRLAEEIVLIPGAHDERRAHVRLEASGIPWLKGARVKYGSQVEVLDVSAGGIQFLSDCAIETGTRIALELAGPMGTMRAVATVRRCHLVPCGDLVRFQIACAFKDRLQLPNLG